jgi:CheY-like chemotaxis protein
VNGAESEMLMQKVLIVGDNRSDRDYLTRLLENHGYLAACAANESEALARGARERFDLILLDFPLRGREGWETLRRFRLDASTAEMPVVLMTGGGGTEDFVRAYAGGASYYLTSPCRSDELLRGLRLALGERRGAEG